MAVVEHAGGLPLVLSHMIDNFDENPLRMLALVTTAMTGPLFSRALAR